MFYFLNPYFCSSSFAFLHFLPSVSRGGGVLRKEILNWKERLGFLKARLEKEEADRQMG